MRNKKLLITSMLIVCILLNVLSGVVFANESTNIPLDGSIEGLWKDIKYPFPAMPTNAISFVDDVSDDTIVTKTDYDGFTNAWTGNNDRRQKSSMIVDDTLCDVLVVTRTDSSWQAGNYGQTVLFQINNIGNANHSKATSKVKNTIRWSIDFKIDLSTAADNGYTRLIEPVIWKTDGTAGSSNNGPVKFAKISNDKYKLTNAMDSSETVILDSGEWYRIQMEFNVNNYTEKTSADTIPNDATMDIVIYSITDGILNKTPVVAWYDNSWVPISTSSAKLVDTFCQEVNFLTFNPAIEVYSLANAYMVREAWYGDVNIFDEGDKVTSVATISPGFTAGGNYAEPSSDGTPVLVLAGYDDMNTLISARADISDLSTSMTCELSKDSKVTKYSAYLWKAPDEMQLFASPKELVIQGE